MKDVINIENLSFKYENNQVLKNVNIDIKEGDYLGIVGPNGCGKSTLIKLMLNLLSPQKGNIKILGQDLKKFNRWNKIGYVSQKANSFNGSFPATVYEVVVANLYATVSPFKHMKSNKNIEVDKYLDIVGAKEYKHKLIGNLSGGQQQRVFIARALVTNPEIIILDEPTVGVDIESQTKFYDLLDVLNKNMNITIIIVTHDIGIIAKRAKKIVYFENKEVNVKENISKENMIEIINKMYGKSNF